MRDVDVVRASSKKAMAIIASSHGPESTIEADLHV
jgi:hypothetical protein